MDTEVIAFFLFPGNCFVCPLSPSLTLLFHIGIHRKPKRVSATKVMKFQMSHTEQMLIPAFINA